MLHQKDFVKDKDDRLYKRKPGVRHIGNQKKSGRDLVADQRQESVTSFSVKMPIAIDQVVKLPLMSKTFVLGKASDVEIYVVEIHDVVADRH